MTTPAYLRHLHNAFAHSVPRVWDHYVSVYGPLATMEQFLAAKLGGASAARITFWLKLWDSAAFAVVAVVLDRLLRHNPAQRLRAHLLWTVNPLLLWDLVAAGHLDVLAVMAGLLGLLVLGEQPAAGRPGWRVSWPRVPCSASQQISRSTTCCSAWVRPGPCAALSRPWLSRAPPPSRFWYPATPTSGHQRSGPCSAGATRAAPTTSTGRSSRTAGITTSG